MSLVADYCREKGEPEHKELMAIHEFFVWMLDKNYVNTNMLIKTHEKREGEDGREPSTSDTV